jgi:hypothetical protein
MVSGLTKKFKIVVQKSKQVFQKGNLPDLNLDSCSCPPYLGQNDLEVNKAKVINEGILNLI